MSIERCGDRNYGVLVKEGVTMHCVKVRSLDCSPLTDVKTPSTREERMIVSGNGGEHATGKNPGTSIS
jgi:hypothetical protein